MMFDQSPDPVFPALATLTTADLIRITGAKHVELLRFRRKPGQRAVLHVATGRGKDRREGAIWFLWPDKAERLRQANPGMAFDPVSGALFETFPNDHRLPEAARFLADAPKLAGDLMGGPATGDPYLLRYRPGLSATFRWTTIQGSTHFVKIARKAKVMEQADLIRRLAHQLEGTGLSVAPVSGVVETHAAIAYRGASGTPFDTILGTCTDDSLDRHAHQLVSSMGMLWQCRLAGLPQLRKEDYMRRAQRSAEIITIANPLAGALAQGLLDKAAQSDPFLRDCPIHGDMKLDHAFSTGSEVTFIDTESLHLGDPDYDLALLDARLDVGCIEGWLTQDRCDRIRNNLRQMGGKDYGWFLSLARIHAAKYFAQRTMPDRHSVLVGLMSA
jgi:hypothetical protein